MDVVCRPATAADVPAIATVRIRSWQAAYRGAIPQDYLDSLDVDAEAARRADRPLDGQYVAELNGAVVGWVHVGPYRVDEGEQVPGPSCGEVSAISALPEPCTESAKLRPRTRSIARLPAPFSQALLRSCVPMLISTGPGLVPG